MWILRGYLKPYWKAALASPLLIMIEAFGHLIQPKLMANMVDEGIIKGDFHQIVLAGVLMVLVTLIGVMGGIGCSISSNIASQGFAADLRESLFTKIQSFSFRNLDFLKTGSLITRLTNDLVQLQNLMRITLSMFVRDSLLLVGSVIMAVSISLSLGSILVIVIPIIVIVLYFIIRICLPLFSKVQTKLDRVNTVLQENLAGIRVVKAFVRSEFENSRFQKVNQDYTRMAIKAARAMIVNMPVTMLIMNSSIVVVLLFGGLQTWTGSLKVGELVAFISYVTQVLFSLQMMSNMLINISQAKVSADRVIEVLNTEPDIANIEQPRINVIKSGRVEFDHVSFSYDVESEKMTLEGICFVAEPGQTVAIIGSTGSGKSTLVNLISRLYDTSRGRVLIDGVDVREIDLIHLRSNIGMVLQESILFTGCISDNIRFGRPDATQAEVEAAAKAAQAHNFIVKMPRGYDTLLNQRGVNLSGGQKQRLAIARALLVQPPVLIFDDSTSAVDLATEARIQKALKEQMLHSTVFIIAQRITSVLDADKILVLEDGCIVNQGTHDQLMKESIVYQDIYDSQIGKDLVING